MVSCHTSAPASVILLFFSAFLCWTINTLGSRNVTLFAVSISSYSLYHKQVNRGYTITPFFLQRRLAVLRSNQASYNTASSKEINYWLNNAVIYLTSTLKHKDVKEHPVWTLILAAHSSLLSQPWLPTSGFYPSQLSLASCNVETPKAATE